MPAFEDCLYRQFKSGAYEHKKGKRGMLPSSIWPWPPAGVFSPKDHDGVSVDDGNVHSVEQIRRVISKTPRNDGKGLKDPDEYGLVALVRNDVIDCGFEVRPDPPKESAKEPANPAHTLIVKPPEINPTDFRSDLWARALGYEPPPMENLPDDAWTRWQQIKAY